jgi:hypothetical protein
MMARRWSALSSARCSLLRDPYGSQSCVVFICLDRQVVGPSLHGNTTLGRAPARGSVSLTYFTLFT